MNPCLRKAYSDGEGVENLQLVRREAMKRNGVEWLWEI